METHINFVQKALYKPFLQDTERNEKYKFRIKKGTDFKGKPIK